MLIEKTLPKVSVGLPTYNRAATLKQAIDTVLNQDYTNIELVISDNASTDKTREVCEEFGCKDKRVKYIRQVYTLGPTANFKEVLDSSSGEFFMWLSDDDWLDYSYISECTKVLISEDDVSLVSGHVKYYNQDDFIFEGRRLNLLQNSGIGRMLDYYSKVKDNGTFYGVIRRKDLNNVRITNAIGSDFLIVAAVAFLGKIKTLNNISVHRRLGGISHSWEKTASALSLSRFEKSFPILSIAINAFKDIAWRMPVFFKLGKGKRYLVASEVFFLILATKSLPALVKKSAKSVLTLFVGDKRVEKIKSFLIG